jgi:hypothetical protein
MTRVGSTVVRLVLGVTPVLVVLVGLGRRWLL